MLATSQQTTLLVETSTGEVLKRRVLKEHEFMSRAAHHLLPSDLAEGQAAGWIPKTRGLPETRCKQNKAGRYIHVKCQHRSVPMRLDCRQPNCPYLRHMTHRGIERIREKFVEKQKRLAAQS